MKHLHIITLVLVVIFIVPVKAVFQVISQPGLYKLGENVTYSPAGPNDIIFQITASNVEFDLAGRFITQDAANVQPALRGIQVASGLTNVTIKGGSIQNIRGTGIEIASNCSQIVLDNITTFSCDDRGINFVGEPEAEITDSQILNCNVIRCCRVPTGTIAVLFAYCNRLQIKNLTVNANGAPNASQTPMRIDSCNNCDFDSVVMQDNIALGTLNTLLLVITSNCTFTNCLIENSTTTVNGTCRAYQLSGGSNNNVFKNCIALRTTAIGQSFGFDISTSNNNLFDHCLVEGSTSTAGTIGFFDSVNSRSTFLDCIACSNASSAIVRGFFASQSSNVAFVNSVAIDQSSTASAAIGFDITNNTSPFMQDCIAARNIGASAALSFGVISAGNTNPVFVNNVAGRNGTTAANQFNGVAAGAVNNALTTGVNSTTLGSWTNLGLT